MTKTIDQFMWAFQHSFRMSVEYEIQKILSDIGLQINRNVKVLLIGLATKDDLPNQICIEPEDGTLVVDDLLSLNERAKEVLDADPESNMFYSDRRHGEIRHRGLSLRSRARAISEIIEETNKFEGVSFFVSNSATLAGYDVHTCVGIPYEILASVPCFSNPKKHDYHGRHIEESFVQTIIQTCLDRADRALYLPHPGEHLRELGDPFDIIRSSAERFVDGISFVFTPQQTDLFIRANEFSSLTYELSAARGHLVITQRDNLTNKLAVTFENRVGLYDTRGVRKILQLTDETNALLSDGGYAYGLGQCSSAPDVVKITIEAHAKWSLSIDGTILMKVSYEHATLPKQIIDKEFFKDIAERTVGAIHVERVWDIFQSALDSGHGTTIVISQDPVSETTRLGKEALPIKPEYLNRENVARLGRVDGAIILGPDGRCYGFGVILDGLGTSSGDRARGARFNSSVRYQQTSAVGTMVIVISDDGTVDLIPNLMPRVKRQDVEDAIQAFCEYSGIEGNDGEEWAKRNSRITAFRFYLNQEQCDRVNEAHEKEMDSRPIKIIGRVLEPDPDMNESFFWG